MKKAPWGSPIGIALRDFELCIGKHEAAYILVKAEKKKSEF